jgi:hypothetical protein
VTVGVGVDTDDRAATVVEAAVVLAVPVAAFASR